ncbi:hypothetical protein EHS13_03705 [Paenibacillus psychroresistens]|uniref:Pyridoxamine 5'-phosphate oxidase family protein n=1 Tax=Paenibacillus psychroresistens TaxID=1778678 RepID=A0A6B8RF19_9BACL|nr:hypothetical protein [Paenibacillus psychroresistens]QGQ94072.1 hypothetical protein EHS13_03705 [Paenibacillus psychroresistens]
MKLAADYVEHLHGAVFIYVDSYDDDLQLNTQMAQGVLVSPDREDLSLYILESQAHVLLANLLGTAKLTLTVTDPLTLSTLQLNGVYLSHGPSDSKDRALQNIYAYKLNAAIQTVWPSSSDRRDSRELEPMLSIVVSIDDIIKQTPELREDIQMSI